MPPFNYEPYRNPYVGTIADLLMAPGQIEARKAEQVGSARANAAVQSGNAWAGAAQGVGNAVSGAIQQATDPRRKLIEAEVSDAKRRQADMQALDEAYLKPGGREAVVNALPGHLRGTVLKQFEEQDKLHAETEKAQEQADALRTESWASLAIKIRAHQYDPIAAQLAVSDQKLKYAGNPAMLRQVQSVEQQIQANPTPEGIQRIVDPFIAASPKQQEIANAGKTADSRVKQAETSAAKLALETPKIAAETQKVQAEVAGTLPPTPAQAASNAVAQGNLKVAQGRLAVEQQKAAQTGADKTDLTPEGLDAAALNYAKTGNLPPLGMGDKTTRKQIINRAAQMMPGLDIASAKADYTANQASLTTLQKQRDAISAFEKTAGKNIDIFLEQAGKVVDTGSPMANTLARQVSGKMLGSPDQAAYDAARQVAINEIAKITNNPNLSGTLSDSARHEVEAFNPQSATLKQSVSVMRILKQDMANRASAMDDQLAGIRARISKVAATTPAAGPHDGEEGSVNGVAAVWKTVNGKTGWYAK